MTDALLTPDQAAELLGVPRARVLGEEGAVSAILRRIPKTRAAWESRACFEASDPPRWGDD